jgi:predicted MFS family arabinose efflux permease
MVPISSLTYNTKNGPRDIITATTLVPLLLLPFIYWLKEKRMLVPEQGTREQLHALWKTACSRAVWQPMGFISLYLAMFVSNAAWREFLKSVLGFTPNQLNALLFVAGALAFAGVVVYKFVLIQWSWRTIFILGISFNGIFSLLQVLLIRGQTFGLDPFLFSLGDDGVRDFLLGTQYVPMMVMMVNLVPEGIEGASYALFTTTWNAASAISDALSTVLLGIWDVSKESLMAGDLSGLTKLTVLTTALQVTPLLFVGFMPHSIEDLNRLKSGNDGAFPASSIVGGTVYLSLVMLSVLVAVFIGIMNVIRPGWMGES